VLTKRIPLMITIRDIIIGRAFEYKVRMSNGNPISLAEYLTNVIEDIKLFGKFEKTIVDNSKKD
jgi:hypothetical protein